MSQTTETIRVRMLVDNHEHAGKRLAKDAIVKVAPHVAQQMVAFKAAELVTSGAKTAASAKKD
ncbi:hypothetical protein [Luteimonas terricola]|uniref:Uncharacterized protein n=1 Tax=Luteimonas terricola TaxID=645597 RepID=A0ABQ2EE12_9GAMM|nr:hypothetical protein [Luteimonas terricola]GGK08587.1 hypothetical protein GCM10011394_17460 [Luteimonas terricola]